MDGILKIIEGNVFANGSKLAVSAGNNELTYDELYAGILSFANYLNNSNFKQEDKVLLRCETNSYFWCVFYGCMLNRAISVLVDNSIPNSHINEIKDRYAGVKLIISDKEEDVNDCPVISYKQLEEICLAKTTGIYDCFKDICDDDVVSIIFTTGTTGKSKGVCWSYSHLYNTVFQPGCEPIDKHFRTLIIGKNNHTLGVLVANTELVRDASIIQLENLSNPELFFYKVNKYKINALIMTPSAMSFLFYTSIDQINNIADQIEFVEYTGEKTPMKTEIDSMRIFKNATLIISYGSTETGLIGVYEYSKYGPSADRVMKIHEFPKVCFFDEDKNEINPSKENPGLICLKTKFKVLGYYKEEELNKQLIRGDLTCMSDLGYCDEEGFLCICGRAGDVISTGGHKVNPTDVEQCALKSNMIKECVCFGTHDDIFGNLVTLDIVVKKEFEKKLFKKFLANNLERAQCPKIINIVTNIKKNSGGKIDRKFYKEKGKNDKR